MKKKPAHGGARKGAGRKPEGEKPKTKIMITLDEELLAKLDRMTTNRSKWIAERIKKAKEP
jgi:hypothetical protein